METTTVAMDSEEPSTGHNQNLCLFSIEKRLQN